MRKFILQFMSRTALVGFFCLLHIHTLCDQLREYHFVPVCPGLMWNIENILAFCSSYTHDKNIEES